MQGYDRYAYVTNSPVNFTDPSGHKECDPEFGCDPSPLPVRHPIPDLTDHPDNDPQPHGGGEGGDLLQSPDPTSGTDGYCGGVGLLYCAANATQDLALLTDAVGVVLVTIIIGAGCVVGGLGGGGGVLVGCVGRIIAWIRSLQYDIEWN